MIDLVRSGRSRREAAAIVAAEREEARRRLPPQPVHEVHPLTEQWLAVCRAPCEQYRHHGVAEYCELDACAESGRPCVRAALQTWNARLFGRIPPCPKQAAGPAPTLVSPARQRVIQIEVTSACPGRCSNCTRFVPHQRAPWLMDFATFRRAVDSMADYGGMLGIMGGEPTLHPAFEQLCDYYRERWAPGPGLAQGREPIRDFSAHHRRCLARLDGQRCGLWSSLGPGYYRHYETIQETFGYQCLNDHRNGAVHQALLATRREAGIADADWPALRDRCWVQRLWSSSINPWGCYPCEIMAAMDALCQPLSAGERQRLGIPAAGGWPIEPGWWRREPADFGRLLDWCELCAAPLPTPARLATDEIQDVSPRWLEILTALGSPAIAAGRLQVLGPQSPVTSPPPKHSDWYMPAGERRIAPGTAGLHPQRIEGLCVSVDCGDELARTLPGKVSQCDRFVVVTATHDLLSQEVARQAGAALVVTDACYDDDAAFNKGAMLNAGLDALSLDDWVLLTDADVFLPPRWREHVAELVLNPGCLYYTRRWHLPPEVREPDWSLITDYHLLDPHGNANPWGYFQLVNSRARALRGGLRFPLCFCSAGGIDHWFQGQWPAQKRVPLPSDDHRFDVLHLWHGRLAARWNGYRDTGGRWCYAGQTDTGRTLPYRWPSWPTPCLLRRTNILTTRSETVEWTGLGPPAWPAPADPAARYEYACKELPSC